MTHTEAREYVAGLRRTNQHRRTYYYVVVARDGKITGHATRLSHTAARQKAAEFCDSATQIAIVHGRDV